MANRLRLLVIVLGGLIVAAIYTFPMWEPLLGGEETNQDVPGLPEDLQPAFHQLPADQQAAYRQMAAENADMAAQMLQAAISPDRVVPEAEQALPQMTNEVVVAEGEFKALATWRELAGKYTLYQLPDNRRLLRLEDFQVTNGPDLRLVLSRHAAPTTSAEVGSDFVDLGLLQGNVGNQNYSISAEVDLEAYQSVVLYSVQFATVFGSAPMLIE